MVACCWPWSVCMTAEEKHPKWSMLSDNAQDLIKQLMEPDPNRGSKLHLQSHFGTGASRLCVPSFPFLTFFHCLLATTVHLSI